MVSVLRKIPIRKVVREKGKSLCVIAAVFFTTVLFVMVFSTLFFVMDAAEEMMKASSPGVMFSSRGNVRRLTSMLVMEAEIDLEEGEIYINDISLLSSLDFSTWTALLALVLLVMWLGYLFISNIFYLSVTGDARFFGKLSNNGITRKEIKKLIRRQDNVLFLAAVVPALLVGYLFSAAVLPGILSAFLKSLKPYFVGILFKREF